MKLDIEEEYDVIIVGGGPVGVALAIELGLSGIKTLILERYEEPLQTPRAQSLSARTMEFFLRWGIDEILESSTLLPRDFPASCIWCSSFTNKENYFSGYWGDHSISDSNSPKKAARLPQWVTENILRDRLKDFSCVKFMRSHDVRDVCEANGYVTVKAYDKMNNRVRYYQSNYLACCDGVQGITKAKFNNSFEDLSRKSRMITVNFFSHDIMRKKQVPDGIFYCVLSKGDASFWGPVELKRGLWFVQMLWQSTELKPEHDFLSEMLDTIFGVPFNKEIIDYQFWDMQVRLADKFSWSDRIFWLGDAAHAFAPTGGLGLNTGFGDAVNLGWKLASVIKDRRLVDILSTYEAERRPVCIRNLSFAKQMAEESLAISQEYLVNDDYESYFTTTASLGKRYLSSSGLTMGYAYLESPLTEIANKTDKCFDAFEYTPVVEPGYFLPHIPHDPYGTIYKALSSSSWNLLISGDYELDEAGRKWTEKFSIIGQINMVRLKKGSYPYVCLLVRPDWHIAGVRGVAGP